MPRRGRIKIVGKFPARQHHHLAKRLRELAETLRNQLAAPSR